MDGERGWRGFVCPHGNLGGKVPYSYCEDTCRDRCLPLAYLYAGGEVREVNIDRLSVTSVADPFQITYLKRNYPTYSDPTDGAWMTMGTGLHLAVEAGFARLKNKDGYFLEEKVERLLELPEGNITLSGRIDYRSDRDSEIIDHKLSGWKGIPLLRKKAAAGDWLGDDKFVQLNIYHTWHPHIEKLKLGIWARDWDIYKSAAEKVGKIELIEVPVAPVDEVMDWVKFRVNAYLKAEKSGGDGLKCSFSETWNGRRCANYCSVSEICPQYQGDK